MKNNSGIKWFIPLTKELVLRTSLIKMFMRCPAQALFRYFKGLIVPPNGNMMFGSCGHKVAEYQNRYKLKKGRDAKLSVLQDVFHEEFKWRRKNTRWLKKDEPNELETFGIHEVIPEYYHGIGKKTEPLYVEEPFQMKFPELNLIITGTMDCVEEDLLIKDLKFKGRAPKWDEGMKSTQGKMYQLGFKSKFKRSSAGFLLEGVVKKNNPECFRLQPSKMKLHEEEAFKEVIKRIAMQIRMGLFYPRRENNYFCSSKGCGYWGICSKGGWMKLPKEVKVFNQNTDKKETEGGEEDS